MSGVSIRPAEPGPVVAEEDDDLEEERREEHELGAEAGAFEREYIDDHSWEDLEEDEQGRLRAVDPRAEQRAERRRLLTEALSARIRRGLIRYLEVVLDMSRAAAMTDFRPTRFAVVSGILQAFIREFFDQNPLSHLGIILLRNGVAERLTDLSGSPEAHIARLKSLEASGDASLMNGLDTAVSTLKSIPPYGHREALFLLSALSTCDPGNILDSLKTAKQHRVRVSVVGIAAQVHICETMTKETGGLYGVALDEAHLEELVRLHAPPPPTSASSTSASMVRMGFPQRNPEGVRGQAFIGESATLSTGGFTCPKCRARVAELPGACHVCGLTLISSPHLARSYHHLFPVRAFEEVPPPELARLAQDAAAARAADSTHSAAAASSLECHACCCPLTASIPAAAPSADGNNSGASGSRAVVAAAAAAGDSETGVVLRCGGCKQLFCFDCDLFIHESLHNCPGCEAMPSAAPSDAGGAVAMEEG